MGGTQEQPYGRTVASEPDTVKWHVGQEAGIFQFCPGSHCVAHKLHFTQVCIGVGGFLMAPFPLLLLLLLWGIAKMSSRFPFQLRQESSGRGGGCLQAYTDGANWCRESLGLLSPPTPHPQLLNV